MLDRIRNAVSFAARARHHGRLLRRRRHAGRPRVLPPGVRDGGRGGREGGGRRGHDRDRHARGRRRARRRARASGSAPTSRSTSTATTTSGSRPPRPSPPCGPARRWIQGTINGMGERGGNANLIEVALDAATRSTACRRTLRLDRAREVSAPRRARRPARRSSRGSRSSARTSSRRESGAVASQFHDPEAIEPYSSELVGAERSDRARQEERHRLDPDRGRASSASTCPRSGGPSCSPRSRRSAPRSAASSPTRSSRRSCEAHDPCNTLLLARFRWSGAARAACNTVLLALTAGEGTNEALTRTPSAECGGGGQALASAPDDGRLWPSPAWPTRSSAPRSCRRCPRSSTTCTPPRPASPGSSPATCSRRRSALRSSAASETCSASSTSWSGHSWRSAAAHCSRRSPTASAC